MSEIVDNGISIYIIAGEPSGDFLGANLMRALREQSSRPVRFYGIGGEKMEAEGLDSLFPYHELSMMGLLEILPYLLRTLLRMSSTIADINMKQPDMLITIDSPGFNFRIVEKLRKQELQSKFVHYVAPTVWAYKPERAAKCARLFDHLLVLLPFEPKYFTDAGLDTSFVGHPIIAESTAGSGVVFRAKYEIDAKTPVFCLLPGSRKGEVKRHMRVMARAVGMLSSCYPNPVISLAVPEHLLPIIAPFLNSCPFRVIIAEDEEDKKNAIAASNFAFVKSGTVAFEVAAASVPMLVTYRMNRFSVFWLRRMIKIKYANLINILLNREAIPELLQERALPIMLASCANTILSMPEIHKKQQKDIKFALSKLLPESEKTPSQLAAERIISLLS